MLILKQGLNVLISISFLALIALGLHIIFNLMRVINMAHGDFLMLGAYFQHTLTAGGLNFWIAALLATLFTALIGAVAERLLLRSLYKQGELSTLLATWGLSVLLQQLVTFIYGPQTKYVPLPITGLFKVGGFEYPPYNLLVMLLAWATVGAVLGLLLKSRFGIAVRATMDNRTMAGAMGIATDRIFGAAFALGTAIAGLAGALLSPILGISPYMGLDFITKSFFVVIVGGTASAFNTLGGAVVIGGPESLLSITANATLAQIAVLLLVIIIMFLRPEGLFARAARRSGI